MQKKRAPIRTTPYAGTGTEVVDALDAGTNIPAYRLLAVAEWHDQSKAPRHIAIAARLRAVAANDNEVAA